MSAHQPTAEASTPVSAEAVQDFIAEQFLGGGDEPVTDEEEEENPESDELEGDEVDGEESEASDDQEDEEGEAPEPIDPPVSWDKDAKELFAQLPPELQSKVAEREAQREKAIQSATTAAAEAKRNAVAEANALFADTQRQYASHLEQLASQFAPQRPDPALLAQDPQAFYYLQAKYEQDTAQRDQLTQQATQAKQEAEQREHLTRQHEIQETHRLMSEELGEVWTDPKQRQALLTDLDEVGALLGYAPELVAQANATDLKALVAAREWKAKAEKYDALQKTKMEAVRAAKGKPRVNKPGVTAGSAEKSARSRDAAWDAVKASRGKSGDAAASYLEKIGIKL